MVAIVLGGGEDVGRGGTLSVLGCSRSLQGFALGSNGV